MALAFRSRARRRALALLQDHRRSGTCSRSSCTSCSGRGARGGGAAARGHGRRAFRRSCSSPSPRRVGARSPGRRARGEARAPRRPSISSCPSLGVCALTVWESLRCTTRASGQPRALLQVAAPLPARALPLPLAAPAVAVRSHRLARRPVHRAVRHAARASRVRLLRTTAPAAVVFAMPVDPRPAASSGRDTRRGAQCRRRGGRRARWLLLLSVATLVGYLTMWHTTTSLLPGRRLLGAVLLARRRPAGGAHSAGESCLFLLLALAAFVGLVQFPFGAPVYFCFVAPLAVLAWLAMFRHTSLRASAGRRVPGGAPRR